MGFKLGDCAHMALSGYLEYFYIKYCQKKSQKQTWELDVMD